MNLLLDTISLKNALILFDDNKNIITQYFFDVKMNESTRLIEEFDNFLKTNNLVYKDIKNIVVVAGPGSFTGIRTTVLLVNTINFVTKGYITPINYFQLFDNYPIIKSSSKRDSFVKWSKNDEIQTMQNDDIKKYISENNIKTIYSDIDFIENINIMSDVNYEQIIKNIALEKNSIIEPFYLKKPSIS